MSEFSRAGQQMPTEQRRLSEAEHEKDLAEDAAKRHRIHEAEHASRRSRPWWRFWAKR
jgi:hypothetical protein